MISVIIPFYNEQESIPLLLESLSIELTKLTKDFEIILVDDGSTDGSGTIASHEAKKHKHVTILSHRKKFGKGKALSTGFQKAKGEIIFFLDADLQNDPSDSPRFMNMLEKGYDFANGYRKVRLDGTDKTLPSRIYNWIVQKLFNLELHDINCGFKVMRREVLENIPLYGDNYRVLPILAKNEGYRIGEVEVTHHSRKYGESKYGFFRIFFGFFDIIAHYFLLKYFDKPIHFFGSIGSILLGSGSLILLYLGIERIFFQEMLYRRPILFLGMLLVIVGVQVIATGFIGELIVYLNNRNIRKS